MSRAVFEAGALRYVGFDMVRVQTETTRFATVVFSIVVVAAGSVGCDDENQTDKEPKVEREQEERPPADPEPEGPPEELYGKRHRASVELLQRVVSAVAAHYENDESDDATFPGGTGVEFRSVDEPPKKGTTYEFGVESGAGADAKSPEGDEDAAETGSGPSSIGERLGLETGSELPGQVVYTTGEGVGVEATAVVKVVADFDPSSDRNHTIFQELSVDAETGSVNVFPRLVHHRWK